MPICKDSRKGRKEGFWLDHSCDPYSPLRVLTSHHKGPPRRRGLLSHTLHEVGLRGAQNSLNGGMVSAHWSCAVCLALPGMTTLGGSWFVIELTVKAGDVFSSVVG